MKPKDSEILDASAVALMVGISKRTVIELAKKGDLPGHRVGKKTWRFIRKTIIAWLSNSTEMNILNILNKSRIK